MESVNDEMAHREINSVRTDAGLEFTGSLSQQLLTKHKIKHSVMRSKKNASIARNNIKTLKIKIS